MSAIQRIQYLRFPENLDQQLRQRMQELNEDLDIVGEYLNMKGEALVKSAVDSGALPRDDSTTSQYKRLEFKQEEMWKILIHLRGFTRITNLLDFFNLSLGDSVYDNINKIRDAIRQTKFPISYAPALENFVGNEVANELRSKQRIPLRYAPISTEYGYHEDTQAIEIAVSVPNAAFTPRDNDQMNVFLNNRVYAFDHDVFKKKGKDVLLREMKSMADSFVNNPPADIDIPI